MAIVFIALYLVCSNPGMQKRARELAQREASAFLGAKVEIGDFAFMPFNEARLSDVRVFTPDGRRCVDIATLGAGINLWRLLTDRKIEISGILQCQWNGDEARCGHHRAGSTTDMIPSW